MWHGSGRHDRDRGGRRGAGHRGAARGPRAVRQDRHGRCGRHHAGRGGGDYGERRRLLLAVKDNQPGLRRALEAAFQEHAGRVWTSRDRGRHEVRRARTITARKTVDAVAGAIPGIRTLGRIERTRITKDGIATTVHYHVSTRVLTPCRYARHVRAHWRVEAMHHVVDGALDEDACRIAKAAGVMAALRRLAFTVIAELRGAFSFRRFAEFVRANPTPLLELCATPR